MINVGGGPDGDSFGLINIVPGGRTELEATMDTDKIGTVMLRHGGRHWHNVYGFGGQSITEPTGAPSDDVWMFGLGVGPSLHVGGLPVDIEAMTLAGQPRPPLRRSPQPAQPAPPHRRRAARSGHARRRRRDQRVRLERSQSPFITARTTTPDPMSTDVTVKLWPSLFVGARI